LRKKVVAWAEGPYAGFNDTHLTEILAEREGVTIGRETLRTILRAAGLRAKRKRRPPRHRKRRERSPQKGLMVLWDGSPHPWFGPERPKATLMAAVDDADGELLCAFFAREETSLAYLQLLESLATSHGLPASIYHDRHSALHRNDDSWSLEEQLAGKQRPTQVGQALEELGIESIPALSPQAKGRVERLFGVLQDRLLAEMRLDGITTPEAANRYLEDSWIQRYNHRFQRKPASAESAYRTSKDLDLKKILSFRYQATVLNDNTVHLGGLLIDIPPGPRGRSYAKARVEARQHLDGSWSVYYHEKLIAQASPTPLAQPKRARRASQSPRHAKASSNELLAYLPDSSTNRTLSLGT